MVKSTASEIRTLFTKNHGNMAGTGAVKHLFHRKGQVPRRERTDSRRRPDEPGPRRGRRGHDLASRHLRSSPTPHQFEAVHKALEAKNIKPQSAEVVQLPLTPVSITDEKTARAVLAIIDALEDNDDVQNVYSNYDIPDDLMEKVQAAAA